MNLFYYLSNIAIPLQTDSEMKFFDRTLIKIQWKPLNGIMVNGNVINFSKNSKALWYFKSLFG